MALRNAAAPAPSAPPTRLPAMLGLGAFAVLAALFCGYFFTTMRGALAGEAEQAIRALSPQELNRAATDLVFENEAGEKVALSSFKGKPIFLNFWATWCAPCRDEMPSVEAMAHAMRDRGLLVLLVSTDDTWEDVRTFYGDKRTEATVLRDPGAAGAHAWGTMKFPETYLIDPSFSVRHRFIGPRNWASAFALRYLGAYL